MKNIFHILLILTNISINYSFHFNNNFLSRRNILNYALFSPTLINDNIQMNNLYSNNNTNYNKPNIYINKKLKKEDFDNYHKKSHLYSKSNIFFNGELNDETCFKLSEALLNHKNTLEHTMNIKIN